VRKRFFEALDTLQQSFAPVKLFDVKKLKGYEDTFRIRIGDWRMLYEFRRKEDTIVVFEVGPRGRIDY
jgi:mRNA interferase RelE/StbE